jgi:hypothetical protein
MFTLQSIIYIFKIQSYIMHTQARMRVYACFSLAWDLLRFLIERPNKQEVNLKNEDEKVISCCLTRKLVRINHKRLTSLYLFVGTWLITTGSVVVLKETYQFHQQEHPLTHVQQQLRSMNSCIERLDKVVTLTTCRFVQYQTVQAKQWLLELNPKVEASKKEKEHEIDHHCKKFFDTYKDMSLRSEPNEESLDSRDGLEIYEKESARDLMDLDYIYHTGTMIECTTPLVGTHSTELEQVHAHIAPTDQIAKLLTDDD